jgi:capsular exopolysaccharide synthesis family protein
VELSSLLRLVSTYRVLIIGATIVAALIAAGISAVMPRTYMAEARLVVGPTTSSNVTDYSQLLSAQALAGTYAQAAVTNGMAERVIDRLKLTGTAEELLGRVNARSQRDSSIVTISVADPTPRGAAAIANDIAQDLIDSSAALQGRDPEVTALVQEQISVLRGQIGELDARIAALRKISDLTAEEVAELDTLQGQAVTARATLASLLESASVTSWAVSFLDRAIPPVRPSSPQTLLNVIVAALLGLVGAVAVAAALRALDDTVKSGDDVRAALGLPLLGAVSHIPLGKGRERFYQLVMLTNPRSPAAEAFRAIRTNIEHAYLGQELVAVLVTSPSALDGKSTVAANLALAFAQAGKKTVLVDADMRSPSAHDLFRVRNDQGLTTYLQSDSSDISKLLRPTPAANLQLLTSGQSPLNPADLLGTARTEAMLAELKEITDLVVIDSPPLNAVTDAAVLAGHVDAVVLVIATARTRRRSALAAEAALRHVEAAIAGVVLNRRDRGRAAPEELSVYPYYEAPRPGAATEERG